MAGTGTGTVSRMRTRLTRSLTAVAVAAVAVVATPGTASAAGPVTGFLDCYRINSDSTITAVLGYTNPTGSSRTIPHGTANQFTPTRLQGSQPTTFAPGTVHAAFSVTLTWTEANSKTGRWNLDGTVLQYVAGMENATSCPQSMQLPADGNGLGPLMVFGAAGLFGAALIARSQRRARRSEPETSAPSLG
ncbi:hypothetical protein [Trujillonella endophytica]|uniref:LPXTG-motif cell wall anchor domain-containing protein n=1 Tax=Trujillonella endophytica TaxID=673521 RepID=A0A1H8WRZ7_9ACTN|nr:hypothetical protein [Trujillella endophytica]SEP30435.1 hypothetical protein SAMN05660991_04680 [Trujillella endophytica]